MHSAQAKKTINIIGDIEFIDENLKSSKTKMFAPNNTKKTTMTDSKLKSQFNKKSNNKNKNKTNSKSNSKSKTKSKSNSNSKKKKSLKNNLIYLSVPE